MGKWEATLIEIYQTGNTDKGDEGSVYVGADQSQGSGVLLV
jgi:hypothetical protein